MPSAAQHRGDGQDPEDRLFRDEVDVRPPCPAAARTWLTSSSTPSASRTSVAPGTCRASAPANSRPAAPGPPCPEPGPATTPPRRAVVVLLVVAQAHRVRRRLHARQQRREQLLLGEDQVCPVVVGELVLVGHRQRAGRAGLDAQAAQDAAQVVDLVDAAVPLPGGEPLVVGVVRALDVDGVGRAGPGAQLAADALLQAVGLPVEQVPAVEPRRGGLLVLGVLLGVDLLEHRPEGDAEPLDRV